MEFKVGDICEAFGLPCVVEETYEPTNQIKVKYDDYGREWFFLDGKFHSWHKEPSLKLIERPKKMVKKSVTKWCNIYNYGGITLYESKDNADFMATDNRVACIEKTFEWEEVE